MILHIPIFNQFLYAPLYQIMIESHYLQKLIFFIKMIRHTQKLLNSVILSQMICFKFGAHGELNRDTMILRNQKSGYYLDPNEVARRIIRVISLHDNVKNPQSMTLSTQWWELGINELDYVEIMIGVENQFKIQISDEVVQKFKDINDAVQYVSRSFWAA